MDNDSSEFLCWSYRILREGTPPLPQGRLLDTQFSDNFFGWSGTSNIAAKIQQPAPGAHDKAENTLLGLILPAARAQESSDQPKAMLDLQNENRKLRAELAQLEAERAAAERERLRLQQERRATDARAKDAKKSRDGFFRTW